MTPEVPAKPRRRKWWKRLALGALALVLLATTGVVVEWYVTRGRDEARLAEAVARLDAEDPGWRLHDLHDARNAGLPPPGQNAGEQMLLALDLTPPDVVAWSQADGAAAEPVSNRLPDQETTAADAARHRRCDAALATLYRACALPAGGFALTPAEPNPLNTLLPKTQRSREAVKLLALDTRVRAGAGDSAGALAACGAIVDVASRGVGDEPTLISQLVRIAHARRAVAEAERALAWATPGPADGPALAALQAKFLAERDAPRMTHGLRGDRAILFRLLENADAGALTLDGYNPPGSGGLVGRAARRYHRRDLPKAQLYALDFFNDNLAAQALPEPERLTAVEAINARLMRRNADLKDWPFGEGLAHSLLPAAGKIQEADARVRAQLGCAAAALAGERFRLRTGRWPATLREIPADILAAVPADPHAGGPLRYRLHAEGATVYAAGADLKNDGGVDIRADISKSDLPGGDFGFRLWNPELRRAAPLPKSPEDEPPE